MKIKNINFKGVMLANILKGEPEFPVIIEPKYDGIRVVFLKTDFDVKGYTRNENLLNNYGNFDAIYEQVKQMLSKGNWMLDTECFVDDWSTTASLLRTYNSDKSLLKFYVFDIINLDNDEDNLYERKKRLQKIDFDKYKNFVLTPYVIAHNMEDYKKAYNKWVGEYEGIMLKDPNSKYVFDRSFSWLKVKPYKDITATIIGFEEGRGKYKNALGAFILKTKDGKIFRCGGGLLDSHRYKIWNDKEWWKNKKIDISVLKTGNIGIRYPEVVRVNNDPDPKKALKIRFDI